ncbi:MAG: helix-turn-helix domain-containing protein [Dysgonomonas sp.]|nr:helix-turn-helix domain-containing protein [Dysgonomonas sp.]
MDKNSKIFQPVENCPIRNILCRLGDKWAMLILVTLKANGTMRFGDLHREINDISQRMLTVTLRSLEADGLISRCIYPEVPPRVEYSLTEMGDSFMPHLNALVDWASEYTPNIMDNRELYK